MIEILARMHIQNFDITIKKISFNRQITLFHVLINKFKDWELNDLVGILQIIQGLLENSGIRGCC